MRSHRVGFAPDYVDYMEGWELQKRTHAAVVAGEQEDTVLLLEHAPTYTAGKLTEPHERPLDGTPVIDVDRGGKITWHGPGQLVGYPIVHLPNPRDVVAHVRRIEDVLIQVGAQLGVSTQRVKGRSGVWVSADERGAERKIAAIGIRVSRDVTMHGFALNANCDLGWGNVIVPCGIADAGVTSLSRELDREVTVEEVLPLVENVFLETFSPFEDYWKQRHAATA